mgnify:CR=1 FL=1
MSVPVDVLAQFEDAADETRIVVLCHLASGAVAIDEDELNAAIRRAQLLLATGGDPRRELELDGRAVVSLADDLDEPERRSALSGRLRTIAAELDALPHAGATVARLLSEEETAWRGYAAAMLADSLAEPE